MRPRSFVKTLIILLIVLVHGLHASATLAEQSTDTGTTAAAAASKETDALEKSFAQIAEQREIMRALAQRTQDQAGAYKKVMEKRLERAAVELLDRGVTYAEKVAAQEVDAADLAENRARAAKILAAQFQIGLETLANVRAKIAHPEPDLTAAQLTSVYVEILDSQELVNRILQALADNLALSQQLANGSRQQEAALKKAVEDVAVSRSILLEIETREIKVLRERVKAVADDAELKSKLAVATSSLKQVAENFSAILGLMDDFEMEASFYREQVLHATGTLSADTVEIDVVTDLLVGWGEALWNFLIEDGPDLVFKAFLLALIVVISFKLGNLLKRMVEKAFDRSHLQVSELLRRMIVALVRNFVLILGLLIALSQMGISLGPLLAGFGIIGFVIGFALQDSLSNFASGFMILIYRPYDVGDIIESGGMLGRVNNMSFVNTTIITFDNQNIIIPNSKIWNDVIKNVTSQTHRRVDMLFGIAYSDDVEKAETVLLQILQDHDKVLEEPEPVVRLHELGESSVNFIVRPWVLKEDYWEVYWDVTRTVKLKFDEAGLSIPFPQRDVHLYPQEVEER